MQWDWDICLAKNKIQGLTSRMLFIFHTQKRRNNVCTVQLMINWKIETDELFY